MSELFGEIQNVLSDNPFYPQAEQKRGLYENDTRFEANTLTRLAPRSIGQVWAMAEKLLNDLDAAPQN